MARILHALVLILLAQCALASDWPTFRGNNQRTGAVAGGTYYSLDDVGGLWEYETGGPVDSSPAIADIDNDTLKEVVFGSDDKSVYALDYEGGLLWRFGTGGRVRSSPTVADLNSDGRQEILIGSDDGNLYALDRFGALIWKFKTGGPVRSSPLVDELDDVQGKDVVIASYDGKVYGLSSSGAKMWEYKTGDSVESSPASYDIDGDSKKEVIIGSNDNIIYVMKYPPYKVWSYLTDGDVFATPAIDKSGKVMVGSEDAKMYRLEIQSVGESESRRVKTPTGWATESIGMSGLEILWNYTSTGAIKSSPAVGTILGGGNYGLTFGNNNKQLYFLRDDGTVNDTYTLGKSVESSPAVTDLNGDNVTDVIVGDNDGGIYVIDYPGVRKFSYHAGGAVKSSAAAADLTGDGTMEFAIGSDDGKLYVFGDRRGRSIGIGDGIYVKAMHLRSVGNLSGARQLLNDALDIYTKVKYAKGIAKADGILKTMDADVILRRAQDLYEAGNLTEAGSELETAAQAYQDVNSTDGIRRSETLYKRIEAERYYEEAKYYFDQGLHYNASVYIEAAKAFYRSLNDSEGLAKSQNLSTITKTQNNAETYVEDGLKAVKDGRLDAAKMLLGFAKQSYELAGSDDDVRRIDNILNTIIGDEAYQAAAEAYNATAYENATIKAQEALDAYQNSSKAGAANAEALLRKAQARYEASNLYDEADQYLRGSYYKKAAELALNASRMFNESQDYEGYQKAQRTYQRAMQAQTSAPAAEGTNWTRTAAIAVILIAAAALLLGRHAQPKPQHGRMPAHQQGRPMPPFKGTPQTLRPLPQQPRPQPPGMPRQMPQQMQRPPSSPGQPTRQPMQQPRPAPIQQGIRQPMPQSMRQPTQLPAPGIMEKISALFSKGPKQPMQRPLPPATPGPMTQQPQRLQTAQQPKQQMVLTVQTQKSQAPMTQKPPMQQGAKPPMTQPQGAIPPMTPAPRKPPIKEQVSGFLRSIIPGPRRQQPPMGKTQPAPRPQQQTPPMRPPQQIGRPQQPLQTTRPLEQQSKPPAPQAKPPAEPKPPQAPAPVNPADQPESHTDGKKGMRHRINLLPKADEKKEEGDKPADA